MQTSLLQSARRMSIKYWMFMIPKTLKIILEKIEDSKIVIRSRTLKKDKQLNDQKKKEQEDKQWTTKYYTEN